MFLQHTLLWFAGDVSSPPAESTSDVCVVWHRTRTCERIMSASSVELQRTGGCRDRVSTGYEQRTVGDAEWCVRKAVNGAWQTLP